MPDSFVIRLEEQYRNTKQLEEFAKVLTKLKYVDEVEYGKEWVERLEAILSFLKIGRFVGGFVMALGLVFIISNTIRLSIYARSE